ncbi:hypothetical protein SAMN06297358_0521 [Pedobacter xixiisoli]|uniref:Uncharacterized protein n=1 Tax=Pedobacter xixiisoli TaxID=1476464 RepID=A0A285ZR77_9SPHI|nr:hypothetical protein SAMN06297358_0521 [Pedobacter xixiisoli]
MLFKSIGKGNLSSLKTDKMGLKFGQTKIFEVISYAA